MSEYARDVADLRREIVRLVLNQLAEDNRPVPVELSGEGLVQLEKSLMDKLASYDGLHSDAAQLRTDMQTLLGRMTTLETLVRETAATVEQIRQQGVGMAGDDRASTQPSQDPTPLETGPHSPMSGLDADDQDPEDSEASRRRTIVNPAPKEDGEHLGFFDRFRPRTSHQWGVAIIVALIAVLILVGLFAWFSRDPAVVPNEPWQPETTETGESADGAGNSVDPETERRLAIENRLDSGAAPPPSAAPDDADEQESQRSRAGSRR